MTSGDVICRRFEIKNKLGLHARAAARLVQIANRFDAEITVSKDGREANGKSIISLLTLNAPLGSGVEIAVSGPQAEEALAAIGELIERRFDEEDRE